MYTDYIHIHVFTILVLTTEIFMCANLSIILINDHYNTCVLYNVHEVYITIIGL